MFHIRPYLMRRVAYRRDTRPLLRWRNTLSRTREYTSGYLALPMICFRPLLVEWLLPGTCYPVDVPISLISYQPLQNDTYHTGEVTYNDTKIH